MIVTLQESLFRPTSRLCGVRPRYIPYESAYSILGRLALFNVLNGSDLVRLVKHYCEPECVQGKPIKNLAYLGSLSPAGVQDLLCLDKQQVESLFLSPAFIGSGRHVSSVFRYCPICLSQGRHFALFQYKLIELCPAHGVKLLDQCPQCSATMGYLLNANLFKNLFGCWRCGYKFCGDRDSLQSLRYMKDIVAEAGQLRQFHQILSEEQNLHVWFDIAGPEDLSCDDVLQLSLSIKAFAQVEYGLFRDLQAMALDPGLRSKLCGYPSYSLSNSFDRSVNKVVDDGLVDDLVSVSKSIFRNFRKRYFSKLPLSARLLEKLWRDIQGVLLPTQYHNFAAYLDWLCYWRGVRVPDGLLCSGQSEKKRIEAWVAAKKRHCAFKRVATPDAERWLLRQILGCEIVTLLLRQIEQGKIFSLNGDSGAPYKRLFHPVCWAVFLTEEGGGSARMTFISAHSWWAGGEEAQVKLVPDEVSSLDRQDWINFFA